MNTRYTTPAITLHWLMALMLFGLVALGLYMHELPLSPQKFKLYSYHKWTGIAIFVLVLIRLWWRYKHTPPPLSGLSPLQLKLAHTGHLALYGLMLLIPISGWLMSSAKGFSTAWFGILPLPDLVDKNETLAALFEATHKSLNIALLLLVLAHVGAALQHHFLLKDNSLKKMAPWIK